MEPIARCAYCQQPLGSELATVHAASDNYHFLCAMLKQREDQYRQSRTPVAAA
jgi:hypothetical protein